MEIRSPNTVFNVGCLECDLVLLSTFARFEKHIMSIFILTFCRSYLLRLIIDDLSFRGNLLVFEASLVLKA